jgi:hypothetical protein
MSDMDNDALAGADDTTLFNDAVSGSAVAPEPEIVAPVIPAEPVVPVQQTEPAIPPGVLREANERARAAERRAADLEARFAAFERQQPKPEPRPRADVFENPSAFVQEEVSPHLSQLQAELIRNREEMSQFRAEQKHGEEKVQAAFTWVKEGLASRDPEIIQTYQRAMQSAHPYDVITRAHLQRQTISEIGDDLPSYRNRVLEEAMKDPAFQAKVLEATRQQAQQSGQTIARPVSSLPSLTRVGAAALPTAQQDDRSDAELFADATARRKRG